MSCVIMALIISSGASEECDVLQLTVTHLTRTHTKDTLESLTLPSKQSWHSWVHLGEGAWLALPFVELGHSRLVFHLFKEQLISLKLKYE